MSYDEVLGRRIERRRHRLLLTQSKLADRMNQAGFSWHQATTSSVELGQRPLKLNEVPALCQILRVDEHFFYEVYEETNPAPETISDAIRLLQRIEAQ